MPFMAISQSDREVGARTGEMKRRKTLAVQPSRALLEVCIVRCPGSDRVVEIDAGGGKDRVGQLAHRHLFGHVREHLPRPCRVGIGNDVPVDVEIGDLLERRLVGHRIGLVGPRHLGGILFGEHHRVVTGDRQPRGTIGVSLRHALVEPVRGLVETRIGRELVARKRRLFVGIERGDETRTGLVGVAGQEPHQRQGRNRRCDDEILVLREPKANLDRHFGKLFEFLRINGGLEIRHDCHNGLCSWNIC